MDGKFVINGCGTRRTTRSMEFKECVLNGGK